MWKTWPNNAVLYRASEKIILKDYLLHKAVPHHPARVFLETISWAWHMWELLNRIVHFLPMHQILSTYSLMTTPVIMSLKHGGSDGWVSLCMEVLVSVQHLLQLREIVLTLWGVTNSWQSVHNTALCGFVRAYPNFILHLAWMGVHDMRASGVCTS